jgi:hypothetical protein
MAFGSNISVFIFMTKYFDFEKHQTEPHMSKLCLIYEEILEKNLKEKPLEKPRHRY